MIEAAAILGVSQQRVNQLRAEGKLSAVEASGMGRTRILYRRSEVERLRAGARSRAIRAHIVACLSVARGILRSGCEGGGHDPNMALRVQALSRSIHLPLVLLALLRDHSASRHVP